MYKQNHIIDFILNDIESIQSGLKNYQELLKKDLVNLNNEMDVLFAFKEQENLKALQGHHGELKLLKELDNVSMVSYTGREQTFDDVSSEAIFFSHALLHEELLEDVVATAKEIVNYARRHNDTWAMWADDMGVFGLDVLYILAKKHPEYTYLIGGFMVPYWDDEHADYAFIYLRQLFIDYGFTDDLMKAFCYCDGEECRMAMLGISYRYELEESFDLDQYFKDNPEKYSLFKEMLLERYRNQPFLQYSESDYTDRPVQQLYKVIMASSNTDLDVLDLLTGESSYLDYMEEVFIEDTYDNEAYTLQVSIEEALGYDLVLPQKDEEDDEDEPTEYEVWKDFFTNGFEKGHTLWNFIMTGENEAILDELEETDIRSLSKEKDLLFYQQKIKWHLADYDEFKEEFHDIFEGFLSVYYEEPQSCHRIIINGEDISGRQIVIRALDVFYRLLGQHVFVSGVFNLIRDYDVMTTEEFVQRYDLNKDATIANLSSLLSDSIAYHRYICRNDIDRIHYYIEANREKALALFTGKTAELIEAGEEEKVLLRGDITKQREAQISLLEKGLYTDTGLISTVGYLLEREIMKGHGDDLTQVLIDYFENQWLTILLDVLEEGSKLSEADLCQVKKHLVGNPPPPKELFMKAMIEGKEALTKEELALLNPNGSSVTLEEAARLLKEKLNITRRSRRVIHYEVFDFISDCSLTYLLPALYFGGYRLNMKTSSAMTRALKLLGTVAPQKVMSVIYDMGHKLIRDYMAYDFRKDMKRLNLDSSMVLAMEINKAEDEEYQPYVNLYVEADDEPSGGMINTPSKREFIEALVYLDAYKREEFYTEVSKLSPNEVDYLSEFIENLKEFAEDNLKGVDGDYLDDYDYEDYEKGIKMAETLHQLLEAYILDGDNLEAILPMMIESISVIDPLRKNLWRLEDIHRDRFLSLLIKIGTSGIDVAISDDVIEEGYVEIKVFLEKLVELGASVEMLIEWGIESGEEEALIVANQYQDIYPYIADRPLDEREQSLEMLKNSPEMTDFIRKMSEDELVRIKKKAETILKSFI